MRVTPKSPTSLPWLHFKSVPIGAGANLALEIPQGDRRGIYIYLFSDGVAYVGRATDVVQRHTAHMHEWFKTLPGFAAGEVTVRELWFAPVDTGVSDKELDDLETRTITWAGDRWPLLNLAKTDNPGGLAPIQVSVAPHKAVSLSWSREELTQGTLPSADLPEPTETARQKFNRFEKMPGHERALNLIGHYVAATIPEAAACVNSLWMLSAWPNTGEDQRAATLSCGVVETLALFPGSHSHEPHGFLNMKRPEGDLGAPPRRFWCRPGVYSTTRDVTAIEFWDLDGLEQALADPRALDWCHRLNIELMRRAKCPRADAGNSLLEAKVLALVAPTA